MCGWCTFRDNVRNSAAARAVISIVAPGLAPIVLAEDLQLDKVYEKTREEVKRLGRRIGKHVADWVAIALSIVFPSFAITAYAVDVVTSGALLEGYASAWYDDEVELTEFTAEWDYYPSLELFSWFPGSIEWDIVQAGGDYFNSTGMIEPWQKMNNKKINVDMTGHYINTMFEGVNPAAPEYFFPGSGFYEYF